jgi:fimbrial chaperone protein
MQKSGKALRFAAFAALLALAGHATAASLQVAPTSVALPPTQKAEAVWLSNTGESDPVRAQVRVFDWTQVDGEDRLEPTREIIISPPMIELAPGARQLVRVIRAGAAPRETEASYRILVDEVPGERGADQPGLQFLLRYSIPVFVLPAGEPGNAKDGFGYSLSARFGQRQGKPSLTVGNTGRQHAQIADLAYVDARGVRHELLQGLVGYVLPGRTMHWDLPAPSSLFADGGSFKARINGEAVEQTLTLDRSER